MDISQAIVLFLKHHPVGNEEEFCSRVDQKRDREAVRAILDETMRIPIHWDGKTLVDIGNEVGEALRARHPELSAPAIRKLRNYFTYLVK